MLGVQKDRRSKIQDGMGDNLIANGGGRGGANDEVEVFECFHSHDEKVRSFGGRVHLYITLLKHRVVPLAHILSET